MHRSSNHTARRRITVNAVALTGIVLAAMPLAAHDTRSPAAQAAAYPAAPAGLLTPLEESRHRTFVDTAKSQPIELLFLGDSAMEFWRQEGKVEWDRNFAGLATANFGVQGADTASVLWRLRSGELDGFAAKVIVLDALWAGDLTTGASEAEILAGNAAIVAEIRRRQPQARILLMAVPRPRSSSIRNALAREFAAMADGDRVRFLDVTRAFADSDGQFDITLGSGRGSALSEKGYAALAQAIKPALAELLREG